MKTSTRNPYRGALALAIVLAAAITAIAAEPAGAPADTATRSMTTNDAAPSPGLATATFAMG